MSSGIVTTGTILDKIIDHKRGEIGVAESRRPLNELKAACRNAPAPRDFIGALHKPTVALIAEIKHASPSRGVLIDPFDPVGLATFYAQHGASAISVLTDEQFFQGHLDDLIAVRAEVDIPLIRKEFIISPYQIYEARAAGADAILLIVGALEDHLLAALHALATELGLAALVEVHDEPEMERALHLQAPLIGVNNRDLRDFSMDLRTTSRLAKLIPTGADITLVGESGIRTPADVQALGAVHAILVGETIVTATERVVIMQALSRVQRQE